MIRPYVDEHYPLQLYGDKAIIDSGKSTSDNKNNSSLESMLPSWSLFTLPHISYDGHMSACFCDFDSKLYMVDLKKCLF